MLTATFKGSNEWVIHGNHTNTGKPILANDPHLANTMSSIWHQASIKYGDNRTLIGAAIPGMPAILIGKMNKLVWGITNMWGDATDFFEEVIDSNNKTYLFKG